MKLGLLHKRLYCLELVDLRLGGLEGIGQVGAVEYKIG